MNKEELSAPVLTELKEQICLLSDRCAVKSAQIFALKKQTETLRARVTELESQLASAPGKPIRRKAKKQGTTDDGSASEKGTGNAAHNE